MKRKHYSEEELLQRMIADRKLRAAATKESHWWFFQFYFGQAQTFPSAPFHREMFELSENDSIKNLVIVAFRSSGKSTIFTTSYPIWAVLGRQQKKYVVLVGQTRSQARQHLYNIKVQFETNKLLRNDLGPFYEETDEWGAYALVLPKHGARIQAVSVEQSIRGYRHNQHRPDLILCDDIEDIASVKTKENRDKLHEWIKGEVLPAGDITTRFIYVGNYLHDDSFLLRQKRAIEEGRLNGVFRSFPLMDSEGTIFWPGKYPSLAAIEEHRQQIGDEAAWQREFLLRIIPTSEQIIHRDWIKYYDEVPVELQNRFRFGVIAVDPAISGKETADYTAMVSIEVYGKEDDEIKLFVQPHPVNERLEFPDIIARIKDLAETFSAGLPYVFVENVAFQDAIVQTLERDGINVEGVNPKGQDKHTRLTVVSSWIKNKVLFSRNGTKDIVDQLVDFPAESHDDLVDALVIGITKIIEKIREGHNVGFIVKSDFWKSRIVLSEDGSGGYSRGGMDWADKEDQEWRGRNRRGPWNRLMG